MNKERTEGMNKNSQTRQTTCKVPSTEKKKLREKMLTKAMTTLTSSSRHFPYDPMSVKRLPKNCRIGISKQKAVFGNLSAYRKSADDP